MPKRKRKDDDPDDIEIERRRRLRRLIEQDAPPEIIEEQTGFLPEDY